MLVQPQVDPTLGRAFVLGGAPPHVQALRWAAGQGPHRFVQDFRGEHVDISGLRMVPIGARGMYRVFPDPFVVGTLPMLFDNEYPDDETDPLPSSSDTPSTCNGGEPDGGPGDTKLWVVARFQPDPTPVPVYDGGDDEESEAGSDVEPGEGSYEEGGESDCGSVTPYAAEWREPTAAQPLSANHAAAGHFGVGARGAPESVYRTTTNKKMLEVRAPRVALWDQNQRAGGRFQSPESSRRLAFSLFFAQSGGVVCVARCWLCCALRVPQCNELGNAAALLP